MVKRLTGTESFGLSTERSTMPSHVVTLVVLEPSPQLSHQRLHELVGTSLSRMARFRSRVVNKPLGLGQPFWVEVDDFDPGPHLRCATVPAPGSQRGLAELIAGLSEYPLDRRRPLWEAWTIDGLEGDRWALALKMAPALTGGMAGITAVWRRLLGTGPHDDPTSCVLTEPTLGSPPSVSALVADSMREVVHNQVSGALLAAGAMPGLLRAGRRVLQGNALPAGLPHTPSTMQGPVPRTVFNEVLTARRASAFASIPLDQIKAVTRAFGGSVNNVVLAACTLSLRAWLERHDKVPEHPLTLRIPLPLRNPDSASFTNRYTYAWLRFPVQIDDPVQILTHLHTAIEKLTFVSEDHVDAVGLPILDMAVVADLVPPSIVRAGMQLYDGWRLSRGATPVSHGTVSILPRLRAPLYCAGVKVKAVHATAPLTEGAGLNITLINHAADVDISVSVCPDSITAVDEIATGIARSVGILVAAAKNSPRGASPSVVSEMSSHTKIRR